MGPIKYLSLSYKPLNDRGTFSEGDFVIGTVSFTLTKETKIKSLVVKAKGEAEVKWSDGCGNKYLAHQKYFKLKGFLIRKGTVLSQGIHRFEFRFKIPEGGMPSSFRGLHGWIAYTLHATVSTSSEWPSTEKEIDFVSKSFPQHDNVMCPQSGSVNKETGVFSKGQVQLSATIDRRVCSPGDTLSVVAKICNSSSKTLRPEFNLQQVTVYRAMCSKKTSTKSLHKVIGETIASNSEESVSCRLQIPADAIHTLYNCEIISVDYYVKVYLDISFAKDPEVVFPLIVIPSVLQKLPYPGGAAGGPSCSDFPPPAFPAEPYPAHMGPVADGYQAPGGAAGGPSYSDFPLPAFPAEPYPAHMGPVADGYQASGIYPQMDIGGRHGGAVGSSVTSQGEDRCSIINAIILCGFCMLWPCLCCLSLVPLVDRQPVQDADWQPVQDADWQPVQDADWQPVQVASVPRLSPQQANPNGFPPAAFTPPSLLDPASAAPPQFQQGGEPPSYTFLFPHSN